MNNTPPNAKNKQLQSLIALIVCAVIVAGAISFAVFFPSGGFDVSSLLSGNARNPVHYADIEYVRPDFEGIGKDFDSLIEMINRDDSFMSQRTLFNRINKNYSNFLTMLTLANLRFSHNTSDEYWRGERFDLERASVTLRNKLNLLHDTIASSKFKTSYERNYYGENYFSNWKPSVYPDSVVALMETENNLIEEYATLMSSTFVELNGQTIYIQSDEFKALSEEDHRTAVDLYYQKYNLLAGEIYIDLVKTRLQIAEELETDYISYAYSGFGRDYTAKQASDYLDSVAENIIPVLQSINYDGSFISTQTDAMSCLYAVSKGAKSMGDIIYEGFDYMLEQGLYDISFSYNKVNSSFLTYLSDYNSPFMFVSPSNTAYDFLTIAHEFGHYVDSYRNYGNVSTIDAAEVASQAMAFIMPHYTNALYGIDQNDLIEYAVYAATEIYTTQCFISKLEHDIYSLPEEELTIEKINEMAYYHAINFGLSEHADTYALTWFSITHLYELPLYVVSYVISNDVSMQVLEAELNDPGKGGIKAYLNVIDRNSALSFIDDTVSSGFESPFAEGRTEKIAKLFQTVLCKPESEEPEVPESPSSSEELTPELLPAA